MYGVCYYQASKAMTYRPHLSVSVTPWPHKLYWLVYSQPKISKQNTLRKDSDKRLHAYQLLRIILRTTPAQNSTNRLLTFVEPG
jgi:hypothetical protein